MWPTPWLLVLRVESRRWKKQQHVEATFSEVFREPMSAITPYFSALIRLVLISRAGRLMIAFRPKHGRKTIRRTTCMGIWTANDMKQQTGKRVLITGGLSGIGFQAARVMAEKGADVTILGRSPERGRDALKELRRIVPSGTFSFVEGDLANLQSIADCAERLLALKQPIDFLLNVAGVMAVPVRTFTEDGFEMHFGTNHLGHFALTGRLLPLLKAGRVVQVTAMVARWAKLDLNDLQSEQVYKPMGAYAKSKLANVMFAVELNKRRDSLGCSAVAVDPGTANTNLQRNSSGFKRVIGRRLIKTIGYPLDRVADPVVYGAVFPAPNNLSYVRPEKFIQKSGSPTYAEVPKPALDGELRKRLWEISEDLTGVQFPEHNV